MTTHHMRLSRVPFEMIADGTKTIECRLYDKKRQGVRLGDTIIFTRTSDVSQTVVVQVIGLLRYKTFMDMFTHNDPQKFGGEDEPSLTRQLQEYYSEEAQVNYGVLGIEFAIVKK